MKAAFFPDLPSDDPYLHVLEYFARLWGDKPVWAQERDGDIPKTKKFHCGDISKNKKFHSGWPFSAAVLKARKEGWQPWQ